MQSIGYGGNGQIFSNAVDLLHKANDLGVLPQIEQKLKDKAAQPPSTGTSWPDEAKMAVTLVEVILRDPAYKADLDKIIGASPTVANDQNGLMLIGQELARWPQEQVELVIVLKELQASLAAQNNYWLENYVSSLQMQVAETTGDHKVVQDAIKGEVSNLAQQRLQNPQGSFWQEEARLITPMLKEGDGQGCGRPRRDDAVRPDVPEWGKPPAACRNAACGPRSRRVMTMCRWCPSTACAPRRKARVGRNFFWQLAPGDARNRNEYTSKMQWSGIPARPDDIHAEHRGRPG